MGIIRLILAISVVIAHTSPILGLSLVGGPVAVEAFFIISGFYMSLILNEKYVGQNGSYKLFLTNRFLRLFPVYWVVLLLVIGSSVLYGLYTHGYWDALEPYANHYPQMGLGSVVYLFFCNVFIFGQDLVLFQGLNTSTGELFFTSNFWQTEPHLYKFLLIPQAWSVSIELFFYLLAPFIVRKNTGIILLLIGISAGTRLLLISQGLVDDPWNYRFFPNELMFFLLGSLSYKMYKRIQYKPIPSRYLTLIMITLIAFTLFYSTIDFPFKMQLYFGVFFLSLPYIFKYSKSSKWDMSVGDLSYPVYLVHVFLIPYVSKVPYVKNILGLGVAVTIAAIFLSMLLNRYVSNPIERLRQKRLATANVLS